MASQQLFTQQASSHTACVLPTLVFKLGTRPSVTTRPRVTPFNFTNIYLADNYFTSPAESSEDDTEDEDTEEASDDTVDFYNQAYSIRALLASLPDVPSINAISSTPSASHNVSTILHDC